MTCWEAGRLLLQQMADCFEAICPPENIFVVTNKSYNELVKKQLPDLLMIDIAGTECTDTPLVLLMLLIKLRVARPMPIWSLRLPTTLSRKKEEFDRLLSKDLEPLKDSIFCVTLGIKLSRPDTGYGYIQIFRTKKA